MCHCCSSTPAFLSIPSTHRRRSSEKRRRTRNTPTSEQSNLHEKLPEITGLQWWSSPEENKTQRKLKPFFILLKVFREKNGTKSHPWSFWERKAGERSGESSKTYVKHQALIIRGCWLRHRKGGLWWCSCHMDLGVDFTVVSFYLSL